MHLGLFLLLHCFLFIQEAALKIKYAESFIHHLLKKVILI